MDDHRLRRGGGDEAVVGRTAIAESQSYLTGAAALFTLILVHRLASA